ncbi:receptor-like protein EIX1 [Zingiber officinale]|uniref:receptor-like protein EIX1 n=1 Tax=Zingiber officinale TaxID=94328 RepID=UPI001C4CC54A|nr:receptor-like protein EIX1 [Zingiber officinale]
MKAVLPYSFYFSLMLCGLMSLAFSFKEAAVATPTRGCSEVEQDALLAFKANVKDPSNRLASWSPRIDCCKWSGVVCRSSKASNATLFQERLDLSGNDFEGTPIPHFIGSFQKLKYLELYGSNFSGVIPSQLGNLSSLYHLGLQSTMDAIPIGSPLDWLSGLSSLRFLDLTFVNLSTVSQSWLSVVNMLPSLRELYLFDCNLNHIPSSFSSHLNLTSLLILEISYNDFNSTIPNWLWNLTKLSTLYFDGNSLFGPIPIEIATLSRLRELYLGGNNLTGSIPTSIGNLTSLISLNLFRNSLSGPIPIEIGNLTSLTSLDLSWNSFSDLIPVEICNLTSLTSLDLSWNSLSGPMPVEIGKLTSLTMLDLRVNSLSGSIPIEIGKLSKLPDLDLSQNSLVSILSEPHLANLTNLKSLILRENSQITVSLDYDWVPPFQLEFIDLSSCIVGPRFPQWLRSQKSMIELSLSNTSIEDNVPSWFWNISFATFGFIDLSHNKLFGTLPSSLEGMTRLDVLVLSYNKLEGLIPRWPPQILALDLSFNNFSALPSKVSTQLNSSFYFNSFWRGFQLMSSNNQINGSIPSYICNLKQLGSLNLSNNQLSGEIPKCWQEAAARLYFVHLGNNKLSGEIPESLGNLIGLQSLHLNNNNLGGHLPLSLQNCSGLVVLDLADNKFSESIPTWIGQSLQNLTILRLRSNDFSGIIPANLGELNDLQIVDLANNNLSGEIPYSFGNFNAITSRTRTMVQKVSTEREVDFILFGGSDSISIVTKGDEYIFSSILYLVKSIDLSNNSLIGEIPITVGSLAGLQTLNLSRNNLRGKIPYTIGGMISLETLDLSFNNLSDVIPQSLTTLTALSHLNLSYNNLSGQIPSGNQLQTLEDASIYKGNVYLCGDVIQKNCSNYNRHNLTIEGYQNNRSQLLPLYLGSFAEYVTGLWEVVMFLAYTLDSSRLPSDILKKLGPEILEGHEVPQASSLAEASSQPSGDPETLGTESLPTEAIASERAPSPPPEKCLHLQRKRKRVIPSVQTSPSRPPLS